MDTELGSIPHYSRHILAPFFNILRQITRPKWLAVHMATIVNVSSLMTGKLPNMMKYVALFLLLCSFLSLCFAVQATEEDALTKPLVELRTLAKHADILRLTRAHDGKLDFAQLIEQDKHWANSPGNRVVLLNLKMQQFFQTLLKNGKSQFDEILLLGSQGETLAAYPLPNDYWHGNTAKFINVMADEDIFVDELSWDAPTRHIQARISVPIKDERDEMFGVLSVRVNTHTLAEK